MNFKVSVTGNKDIDSVFKYLPIEMSHKVLGAAHAKAAKIMETREKLLAPEGPTGNLVDSIGVVKTPFKKANVIGEVTVGPRRKGRFKGFAGHLVEFGTKKRETRKGANRGVMPAKPFAKPAFELERFNVEKAIAGELSKQVIKTMKKYLK